MGNLDTFRKLTDEFSLIKLFGKKPFEKDWPRSRGKSEYPAFIPPAALCEMIEFKDQYKQLNLSLN